jgi:uroporphyrinogen-III synthase
MSTPRLALTSTADRSHAIIEAVSFHGCEAVVLPCIETQPAGQGTLEEVRTEAAESDWLLITSPRTVAILWPGGGMPHAKAAVVGEATGDAVRRAGGRVAAIGESGLDELVGNWAQQVAGHTVFFPHSAASDLSRLRPLEEHGARVATTVVYETKPVPPGSDPVDAALFASPSAVAGWTLSRSLEDLVIGAIGETTARSLKDHGHPPQVVPSRPDFEMLIDLTARHLRERSPV